MRAHVAAVHRSHPVIWALALALGCGKPADSAPAEETGTPPVTDTEPIETADTEETEPPRPACAEIPCETLSEYGFFEGPLAELQPYDDVVTYTVAAPLWSDNAWKHRAIHLPEGEHITFDAGEDWAWPVGAILMKTFAFPEDLAAPDGPKRIVETRLLVNDPVDGWTGHVYLWDEDQQDAVKYVAGTRLIVEYVDLEGEPREEEYIVPNTNQCEGCHGRSDAVFPLGPFTHQLNLVEESGGQQLERLAPLFDAALPDPATLDAFPDPFGDADLALRTRAYLHSNCAHCHRPGGAAAKSGLTLLAWEEEPRAYGVCKIPAAAGEGTGGLSYDIQPGEPDQSIIPYRMSSTDPEVKMPELPNLLPHDEGVELVRAWISTMDPVVCDE